MPLHLRHFDALIDGLQVSVCDSENGRVSSGCQDDVTSVLALAVNRELVGAKWKSTECTKCFDNFCTKNYV
jgi:hypothetical protein